MMINTSKSSKGFTICLAFNIIIILTVTCNYTLANNQNNHRGKDNGICEIKIDMNLLNGIFINKTNDVVDMIQWGIKITIPRITIKTEEELILGDYMATDVTDFYDKPSILVSSNYYHKIFTVVLYYANVFSYFRYLFNITQIDYIESLCLKKLIPIPNMGSIFFVTNDGQFIIKSLQTTEFGIFHQMLVRYKSYVKEKRTTLLPKFSGFYGFKNKQRNINLLSMNYLLPSGIEIHQKYDLKGSKHNRTSCNGKNKNISSTLKELDFCADYPDGLRLMPHTLSDLLQTIEDDFNFLRSFNVMEYSLLIGVHKINENIFSVCDQAASARWHRLMVNSIRMESILADTGTFPDGNCPSLNGSIPAKSGSGEKLLLFVGIIDILQRYRLIKKIEYHFRYMTQSSSISVQESNDYAERLLFFLKNSVFKPDLPSKDGENNPRK